MTVRVNGRHLAQARLDGKTLASARLNGRQVYSSGIRNFFEPWDVPMAVDWFLQMDPASEQAGAYPTAGGYLVPGVPDGLWSGKPSSTIYTQKEVDNRQGTWEVLTGPQRATAGLYTGIVLATDDRARRQLLAVEWDRNGLVVRYRLSVSSPWVELGKVSRSFTGEDTVKVVRDATRSVPVLTVFHDGVQIGQWDDTSGVQETKGHRHVGVRTQGDRSLFTISHSPWVDHFRFTTELEYE